MESHSSISDTVPIREGDFDIESVMEKISIMLDQPESSNALIKEYIRNVKLQKSRHNFMTDNEIRCFISKHPYFKNPCKYPIRLVNIMKHLKKKGLDVTIDDIDIRVDRIISEMEGITKVEFGLYYNVSRTFKG